MIGEMKDLNTSAKHLLPVTINKQTEDYMIDGITLTVEQAKQIAHAYSQYQEYKG
ncbi:hypothetical protein MHH28_07720 [Paenibacillus sp. FSL K6-1217]|uniref:hypothetical protein n=1 Tax=Paenibacillus sp. FSL K6-1217 TaxID=2921466 RepID=UPI0032434DD4